MRNLFAFLTICALVLASCSTENSEAKDKARESLTQVSTPTTAPETNTPATNIPAGPTTSIEYLETEYDFGTITQGEKVSHVFKFKNTGSEPLIITDAKASCGCTVPKKPTEPIAPGEFGELTVEYNSAGKSGVQNKTVTVTANTNPAQSFLKIKVSVDKPAS